MYYIQNGGGVYRSGGEYRELIPGKVYCFPSKTPYQITQHSLEGLECFYAHMDIAPFVISSLREMDLSEHEFLKKIIEAFILLAKEEKESIRGGIPQQMAAIVTEYLKKEGHFRIHRSKAGKQCFVYAGEFVQVFKDRKIEFYVRVSSTVFHPAFQNLHGSNSAPVSCQLQDENSNVYVACRAFGQ